MSVYLLKLVNKDFFGGPADAAPAAGPGRAEGHLAADAELVVACRAGDQEAWGLLVGRYERLVFSVALRNGVTRDEAADITQMTFIALLESIGRLRDGERLPDRKSVV